MNPIITEVTRNASDSSFSMDELYYRYFQKMPLLFFQTGTTDLYDSRVPQTPGDTTDEQVEHPNKGPDELNAAVEKLFNFLEKYSIKRKGVEIAKYCNFPNNHFAAFLIFTVQKIIVQVRVAPGKQETLTSISVMGYDEHEQLWQILLEHSKQYLQVEPPRQDHIHIIVMSDGDFYLKSIPLVNKNQEFSYDFYNDNFKSVSERVVSTLGSYDESGLVLFHGNPGTGKTSYLKYLLHTITKKKLIYLPPDLIESLSAPAFISFLMSEASNSVLLIEDAENILKHREAGGNQAVSNILNISDGILGDVLRLQIVCTFNSSLNEIDPALLRPGRLIAEYRFEKLTADKTSYLLKKLYGESAVPTKAEMSLAEIFNFNKMPDKTKITKVPMGFAPPSKS